MNHKDIEYSENKFAEKIIKTTNHKILCSGAAAPFDHPHVYLNLGKWGEKKCPYCRVKYVIE